MSERFDNPLVAAVRREMQAIWRETGGGAGARNLSPEYLTAVRVFAAVLDAHDAVWCERKAVRDGKRQLELVS